MHLNIRLLQLYSLSDKPHNPMINAGAIVITSLLKNQLKLPDRFDFVSNTISSVFGGKTLWILFLVVTKAGIA